MERDALVHAAMEKFRLTLRSRPDFDRGCYNLGTVFYTFAMALQGDAGGLQQGDERYCVIAKFGVGGNELLSFAGLGDGVHPSQGVQATIQHPYVGIACSAAVSMPCLTQPDRMCLTDRM